MFRFKNKALSCCNDLVTKALMIVVKANQKLILFKLTYSNSKTSEDFFKYKYI